VVAFLLDSGAILDTDASVRNPLFASIVGRSPSIAHVLLKRGINSRARYTTSTMQDMDATAFALMRGEHECARVIALWNANGDGEAAAAALIAADQIATRTAGQGS
jgi:hypothetical protein